MGKPPLEPPSAEFGPQRRALGLRIAGSLSRRLRYAWRGFTGPRRPMTAAACAWLVRHVSASAGIAEPGLALPALAACGQRHVVQALLAWLLARQAHEGSFPDAAGRPCRIVTAEVLVGLLAALDQPYSERKHVVSAVDAACEWLSHAHCATSTAEPPGSIVTWTSPAVQLLPLAALFRAGRTWNEPRWMQAAQRAARQLRRSHDLCRWTMPMHLHAAVVQALLDLGWPEEAKRGLMLAAVSQRANGGVPALPGVRWVSSAGLARLALCWYQTGDAARADAALAALRAHQHADGSFPGSWGPGAAYHPRRQSVAATSLLIEASFKQVAASFERGADPLHKQIAADDGRLLAVQTLAAELPPGSSIADIGCGQGRYLRELRRQFPQHRWLGIDASAAALAQVPASIERLQGRLLNLPVATGRFDAVYCVEALEHALLPEQAISELCRVVRPGGHLLVIDKQLSFQPLSQHQPWEIWFDAEEVCRWLRPFCDDVAVRCLVHGPRRDASGLFLCWTGTRRASAAARAA